MAASQVTGPARDSRAGPRRGSSRLRRIRVDLRWVDPFEAYDRLRAMAPALFHGAGAHRDAGLTYIAISPAWEVRLANGEWTWSDGSRRGLAGAPLDVLRRLSDGMRHDVDEDGFTGGLVGYFGYGFLHAVEPTLPAEQADTPDAALWLCRDALVFDLDARTTSLWVADLPGESDAVGRAHQIQAILEASPPAGVTPAAATGEAVDTRTAATGEALDTRTAATGESVDAPTETTGKAADNLTAAMGEAGDGPAAASGAAAATVAASMVKAVDTDAAATGEPRPPGPAYAGWGTSMDEASFCDAVRRIRALIFEGDLFQANIATRFSMPCGADGPMLLRHLARDNPSPFMALIEAGDHAVVSCSPELLLKAQGGVISSRPIAGTRKRGTTPAADDAMEAELLSDAKEQAEHTMLVDLLRNDVAKVAVPGSVHVPERISVERYRHVMHLASRVEGRIRPETGFVDWLAALFPGGTITGAPKHRACIRIAEAEPVARGPYTGSAGYLSWSHNAQWNILIRTLVLKDGQARVHAGSGIVADSDPQREWREAGRKAQALLDVASGKGLAGGTRLGDVTPHGQWQPPAPRLVAGRRVLVIDNFDSFTHNLADHIAAIGAQVEVVRNDGDWHGAWKRVRPTHVIISPGPGHPKDSGASLELLASQAREGDEGVPLLGVCLGHQAMGWVTGGSIRQVPPVHGRTGSVHHDGHGIFLGLPSPFVATRYHSLAVELPPRWRKAAWLEDGTLMAMRHETLPWWGLQFHPESLCTDLGVEILTRFLEVKHGRHRVR